MINYNNFWSVLSNKPQATALIKGNDTHPEIRGKVWFWQTESGVIVAANIIGLPKGEECKNPVFGFHIHEGAECSGEKTDNFKNVGAHYNPKGCTHPYHAGDMPALFGSGGQSFMMFLTDRFSVPQIVGKTVIIHAMPDDFHTQPSGNSGEKIACGEIKNLQA